MRNADAKDSTTGSLASAPVVRSPAARVAPSSQSVHVWLLTYWFAAQAVAVQLVLMPEASSPAALVEPAEQATQAWFVTFSLAAQRVASQVVSSPEASSP